MRVGRWGWRQWVGWLGQIRERRRLRKRVTQALQLRPRGGCIDDRLTVKRMSTQLQIEWCARDVHPWDLDLPVERRGELFLEQCRHDTLVAVHRLFARLAEVDVIEIRVVEPQPSARTILAGTVSRHDLNIATHPRSPRMSLKLMGIHHFEAIEGVSSRDGRSDDAPNRKRGGKAGTVPCNRGVDVPVDELFAE